MKSHIIKIGTILLVIVTMLLVLLLIYPHNLSPEQTVEQYFRYFSEKNPEKMNTLVTDALKDPSYDWDYIEYVELVSCYEVTKTDEPVLAVVQKNWNANTTYATRVYVTFNLALLEDAPHAAAYGDDMHSWIFYLAKESDNDPWIIVSYGA